MNNTFMVGTALRFAWQHFKKRPWIFVSALAVVLVAQISIMVLSYIPLAGVVVSFVAGTLVQMGIIRFFLKAHDEVETISVRTLWNPNGFWRYVGTSMLSALIAFGPAAILAFVGAFVMAFSGGPQAIPAQLVALGVVLFVVAVAWGIYKSIRMMFAVYILFDRDLPIMGSIRESERITKGMAGRLFILYVALGLLNVIGILALFVGLFVTASMTYIATVYAYRTLGHRASEVVPAPAPAAPEPVASATEPAPAV